MRVYAPLQPGRSSDAWMGNDGFRASRGPPVNGCLWPQGDDRTSRPHSVSIAGAALSTEPLLRTTSEALSISFST